MPRVLITILIILFAWPTPASAQDSAGRFAVTIEGQGVLPVLGLADRFDAFPTFALSIGRETQPNTFWEVRLQRYDFPRASDLTLIPDTTRSPGVADSLELSLEILGAGVFMQRRLATIGMLRPFVTFGGGFYHWTDRRGEWQQDGLMLDEERRSQWSGGLHGGLGSEFNITRRMALQAVVDYTLMFGELWPTLALGVENVSTFQFVSGRVGIRYYF